MFTRREMLKRSSIVSLSPLLPGILSQTASAAGADADQRVLVVIQLDGGNDGINTVVPFGDDGYGQARRKLRLAQDGLHKLNDHVGLHQRMNDAKAMFDDGTLAIVQGVSYPNPNRSHFRSMKIWQTASFDEGQHNAYGWLGRTLDGRSVGKTSPFADAIFVGEQETPVAIWGRRSKATAMSQVDDLQLHGPVGETAFSPSENDTLQSFVSNQVLSAYASAREFQRRSEAARQNQAKYPDTELAQRLQVVSQLLQAGSHARVYYTVQSGYDTHSSQLYTHGRLLNEFAGALKAFVDDLKSHQLEDRVVVLAFSEFGRRVAENDSEGTDHGTAGPVFLAGSPVRGGLYGQTPDLTDLAAGDLKVHTDFREIYSTLLANWFGVQPNPILGGEWGQLPVLHA